MKGDFLLKELEDEVITQKEITRLINGCIGALDGSVQPPKSAGLIFSSDMLVVQVPLVVKNVVMEFLKHIKAILWILG